MLSFRLLNVLAIVFLVDLCLAGVTIKSGATIREHFAPVLKIGMSQLKFAPIIDAPLLSIKLNDTKVGIIVPGIGNWDDIQNKTELISGKVIIASFGYQIFSDMVSWQNLGAVGVIIGWGQADDWIGFPEIAWGTYPVEETKIPVLGVTWQIAWEAEELQKSLNNTSQLTISLSDTDGASVWRQVFGHWSFYVFSYGMAVMSISVCCVAFIKYREFFLVQGGCLPVALPHICMILETIGALIRFLHWAADPLGARQLFLYFGHIPLRTASLPFTLSSTLLLTFFWLETVSKANIQLSWNLDALKIPAYSVIAVLFLVEIIVDVLYATLPFTVRESVTIGNALLYVVVCVGLAAFFLATTIKIMLKLSRIPSEKSSDAKKRKNLFSVAAKLSVTGLSLLGILFFGIIFSVRSLSSKPIPWTVSWLGAHFCLNAKALSTIIAFRPPRSSMSSSSKSRTNQRKTASSAVKSASESV